MCRFIVYKARDGSHAIRLSDLVVSPSHSIIKQSFDSRERLTEGAVPAHLNGDGFGVGWYTGERPPPSAAATPALGPMASSGVGGIGAPMLSLGSPGYRADSNPAPTKRLRSSPVPVVPAASPTSCGGSCGPCAAPAPSSASASHIDDVPGVYTSTLPAWNDLNLVRLSEKITSPMIFAHVRAASAGSPVTEANCHPFVYDHYMFMHNGFINDFHKVRLKMLAFMSPEVFASIRGTSDSEHWFGVFLTLVKRLGPMSTKLSSEQLQACVAESVRLLEEWLDDAGADTGSLLNFAVTDGTTVIITRGVVGPGAPASLYFASGSCWSESPTTKGLYQMQQADRREHVFIAASERLTSAEEDWLEVPSNHLITVKPNMNVLIIPMKDAFVHSKAMLSVVGDGPSTGKE